MPRTLLSGDATCRSRLCMSQYDYNIHNQLQEVKNFFRAGRIIFRAISACGLRYRLRSVMAWPPSCQSKDKKSIYTCHIYRTCNHDILVMICRMESTAHRSVFRHSIHLSRHECPNIQRERQGQKERVRPYHTFRVSFWMRLRARPSNASEPPSDAELSY